MIVQSFGALQSLTTPQPSWASVTRSTVALYDNRKAYSEIYATQPNVRICVDFLARNIAELSFQIYRRVSDTDRVRLNDHQLSGWLGRPNPATRRYRLMETLVGDLGIYFEAYWLKVRYDDAMGNPQIGLVALPPEEMRIDGGILPAAFVWTPEGGTERRFAPSEIVYFNGYNPRNRLRGLSPLDTLSRILAEEQSAGEHREAYWRNASKQEGFIEQTVDAPSAKWTPTQKQSFREQLQERYADVGGAGLAPVLPAGMSFKPAAFSARDSEYIAGGKLRREVCAAAYHIPQPMVGILDHATFSNIKEQHKHLYQDCLGPWLRMLKEEFEAQVLTECTDQQNVYGEFNIDAKLAGTPEERAASFQMSVGRAWVTVNEARALENLPRIDDPELDKVAPQQGGPAATKMPPAETTPPPAKPAKAVDLSPVIQATRDRQHARLAKLPVSDRAAAFTADLDRWTRELAADLARVTGTTDEAFLAAQLNAETLRQLEADAVAARVIALEQQPRVLVQIEPAPVTVNNLPAAVGKKDIALKRDGTGAVIGAEVVGG